MVCGRLNCQFDFVGTLSLLIARLGDELRILRRLSTFVLFSIDEFDFGRVRKVSSVLDCINHSCIFEGTRDELASRSVWPDRGIKFVTRLAG